MRGRPGGEGAGAHAAVELRREAGPRRRGSLRPPGGRRLDLEGAFLIDLGAADADVWLRRGTGKKNEPFFFLVICFGHCRSVFRFLDLLRSLERCVSIVAFIFHANVH
jgi:hypothetical protein